MNRQGIRLRLLAAGCIAVLEGCATETRVPENSERGVQESAERYYDPGAGWHLDWWDEFDGTSLKTENWNVLTSNYDPVTTNCNFGTGELEFPRAQNVTVGGGKLIISAQRTNDEPVDPRCTGEGPRSFYSGRIHTKGKVEKSYGKLVASIKVPSGYGMWPAFWTLGANISSTVPWPQCGEIDILEWRSTEPMWMQSATHWYDGVKQHWGTGASGNYNLDDGSFHTYEVEWTENSMVFRLDGQFVANQTYTHNDTEFQQNHYVLLNLAIGGDWYRKPNPQKPGEFILPAPHEIDLPAGVTKTMEVEWVRWYQRAVSNPSFESGMTDWATWSPNGTEAADFTETYNGGHSGAYHLTHWSNGTPFEVWTYQPRSGLAPGYYKVRAWVRKGGGFDLARLQAKTCGSCAPVYTDLGTYAGWTLVETPSIYVSGGYLELGFHTRVSVGNASNYIHMDDVELIAL